MRAILCTVVALAAASVVSDAMATAKTTPKQCGPKVGAQITPTPIDTVVATVSKLNVKRDEFETSAAYQTRMKDIKAKLPKEWLIGISPAHRDEYVKYDADAAQLNVRSGFYLSYWVLFGHEMVDYRDALYRLDDAQRPKSTKYDNLDVVVSRSVALGGKYEGSNAFGAKVVVERQKTTTRAIFERAGEDGEDIFFATRPGKSQATDIVFSIPTDPSKARALKTGLMPAVIIVPKWPYFAGGTVDHKKPTITSPYDIDEELQVVIADITCAVLTDRDGRVLGTRTTR